MSVQSKSIRKDAYGYLFIAPFFIILTIFVVYPIIYSFGISFTKWDGSILSPQFVGVENYKRLFGDKFFMKSVSNTWIMWLGCIIPQLIMGLALAVALTDRKIKGKAFFRWIYYLPNLVTMASVGALVFFLLDWQSGSINRLLISLGFIKEPINFLQDIFASRFAVSFTLWWMWFGYSMIIFMAGIRAIPEEYFEAARVDGGNRWQIFWRITLPCLRPIILYQVVTSLIGGLTMFDVPYVLSGGNGAPQNSTLTMVMYLYNTTFANYNFGYGATIGVGLFVLVIMVVAVAYRLINRKSLYE
ncbi:ABC transporter [Geosporobacter ferrireducens]|uniref:ABC transporter n=1 Tax=Geosporobacter ferrireducens TaxID=1424294 RepID=A0A1D8GPY8_9FIRM|nr:ABC transporter [Geosporobacter ferrireducens]